MPWNTVWPDKTISVRANEPKGLQNTQYIAATLGDTALDTTNTSAIKDHIWNVDASLDGRHRFVNMPKFTISGTAADPVLGASCDGVSYLKEKLATEATAQQDVQPFFRNAGGIMQFMTIRAAVLFDLTPNGNPALAPTATVRYAHNVDPTAGVGVDLTNFTNAGGRQFTINYTSSLPSVNYFLQAGAAGPASGQQTVAFVPSDISLTKTISKSVLQSLPKSSTQIPTQIWVAVWGG